MSLAMNDIVRQTEEVSTQCVLKLILSKFANPLTIWSHRGSQQAIQAGWSSLKDLKISGLSADTAGRDFFSVVKAELLKVHR